jgi:anaerobic dimethyl sulfoxide reductase subunit B (iron-sulfur subunit)
VLTIEEGKYPDVFVAWLAASCYHCARPACVEACPAGAITKRKEDGVVVVDPAKCLGKDKCDLCLQSCPYGAPQFGAEKNAKMQMCNLCFDQLKEGKKPICVAGCPMRALDAGPIDELRARYGDKNEAVAFAYSTDLKPSVVFKPKRKKSLVGGRK